MPEQDANVKRGVFSQVPFGLDASVWTKSISLLICEDKDGKEITVEAVYVGPVGQPVLNGVALEDMPGFEKLTLAKAMSMADSGGRVRIAVLDNTGVVIQQYE